MAIDLPADWGVIDIRWPIPGNSFDWGPDNVEPAAAKKRSVIHGTGVDGAQQDGFTMAAYHMNTNGWPGIGVHFVITEDDYPGHQYEGGSTPPGAQIQYVGDLGSIRAGVWGMNNGSVHTEICGLFTNKVPSVNQLRLARKLQDLIKSPNNILSSINFNSQIVYHNQIALPDHGTECPGWQFPQFNEWFSYVQGGAEPSWFNTPPPQPTGQPKDAVIPVTVVNPENVLENEPEWAQSWQENHRKAQTRVDTQAVDLTSGQVVTSIPKGHIFDIAGTMRKDGQLYVRSEYSLSNGTWVGVPAVDLEDIPIPTRTDEPSTAVDIPVNVGGQIDGLSTPEVPMQASETPDRMAQIGSFFWVLIRLLGKIFNRKDK